MGNTQKVLVTGGGGYVGAVLVPKLLEAGHKVSVLDLFWFGEHVFDGVSGHPRLAIVKGDIRDATAVKEALAGMDAVIHLACISNDPSFQMNPELGKSINFDPFEPLVKMAKDSGVKRFVYASSSSVYGIKDEEDVTEDLPLEPLTDYSRFKALCEEILVREQQPGFVPVVIRPATVCGYSPRQRLDLTVNIFTNLAVNKGEITVFGGTQKRPNLHIQDMIDLYILLLGYPDGLVSGKIFNAGYQNHALNEIATMVQEIVGTDRVRISHSQTDDLRSYHISSEKIERELGFTPCHTIQEAIADMKNAFDMGMIPDPLDNDLYYNIRRARTLGLA